MAGQSSGQPYMRVWTFVVAGGVAPFRLTLPGNPPLDHEGGRTLWKMIGSEALADAAKIIIEEQGCIVTCYTEEVTDEMKAARIVEPLASR